MKKYVIIILITTIIITGGWFILKEIQKKNFLKEEAPRIEKYLKYNYENIKSVTFTEVKVYPTGVPHIIGYVNDDKSTYFNAGIYNSHFEQSLSTKNISETDAAFNNGAKSVSEIENEEKITK